MSPSIDPNLTPTSLFNEVDAAFSAKIEKIQAAKGIETAKATAAAAQMRQMESAAQKIELSRIASMILQVDARAVTEKPEDEPEVLQRGRNRLAAQLGCRASDLQDVVESYGEQWAELVLEERLKLGTTSTTFRDITWDRLEAGVLRKLLHLVDMDMVTTLPELLAVARTANQANRGERTKTHMGQSSGGAVQQTNIFMPGNPEAGVLPAGHLGRISLSLSPRVVKQIEGRVVQPANEPGMREIDRIEMLTVEQIQKAGEGDHES